MSTDSPGRRMSRFWLLRRPVATAVRGWMASPGLWVAPLLTWRRQRRHGAALGARGEVARGPSSPESQAETSASVCQGGSSMPVAQCRSRSTRLPSRCQGPGNPDSAGKQPGSRSPFLGRGSPARRCKQQFVQTGRRSNQCLSSPARSCHPQGSGRELTYIHN